MSSSSDYVRVACAFFGYLKFISYIVTDCDAKYLS